MKNFDLTDLVDVLGNPPITTFAGLVGVTPRTVHRWAVEGMNVEQADRAACKAGYHPASIWDSWVTPDSAPAVRVKGDVPPPTVNPPKDCGQYATYKKRGCRCEDCREAARRYEKRRVLDAVNGRKRLIDATPAREHLEWLASPAGCRLASEAAGADLDDFWFGSAARSIGLTKPQLTAIRNGRIKRVRPRTLQAVLSLTTATAWRGVTTPAEPVEADVETLVARGWTQGLIGQEMRRRCGEDEGLPMLQLAASGGGRVRTIHADAIRELVEENAPPPRPTGWELRARREDGSFAGRAA